MSDFQLEQHPVTNAQFAAFVQDTHYITDAERAPEPATLPGVDPELLVPGGLVFTPTQGPVPLDDWQQWWRFVTGACWHRPRGPGSSLAGLEDHPVVLVSYSDAQAYAEWAGRRLPTEEEFEYAARAGRRATIYAWGNDERPNGQLMANTWQGRFPYFNTGARGWIGSSPVGAFPENPWGAADLIGNVWEWTATYFTTGSARTDADSVARRTPGITDPLQHIPASGGCCSPDSTVLRIRKLSTAPGEPAPRRVVKGGSHLCSPEYCHRYRPPARQGQTEDSATTHIGFRCAR